MYNHLFATLTEDVTIITATHRLSNYLNIAYKRCGNVAKADILPIGDWLSRCWIEYNNNYIDNTLPYLLNSTHEFLLWQRIIQYSPLGQHLLQINATAQLAMQAWQLTKQWQLDLQSPAFQQTEDTATWQQWALQFLTYCKEKNWLDINSLPDRLTELVAEQTFIYPKKIILIGFTELNPQYQKLFNTLKKQTNVTLFAPATNISDIQGIALKDSNTEIEQMALWAQQLLQQNPKTTLACIVPNLAEISIDIITTFNAILAPKANLLGHSNYLPYALSSHTTLADYPLIHTAFSLLGLYKPLEFKVISYLLNSPYLGYAEQEMSARAMLEVALRKQGELFIAARELLVSAKKTHCPQLARLITDYLAALPADNTVLFPSQWSVIFTQQLELLGWPGERTLDSHEYQLVERWQALLIEFGQFDVLLGQISLTMALQQLQQVAEQTLYQPQSNTAAIQVLTPIEAIGMQFDAVWVMGLHDNVWPPAAKANPLLPMTLQKQYQLPHATNEQELTFYRALTQQLLNCAEQIIFSYPQYDAERSLRPSALITSLTTFNTQFNPLTHVSLAELIQQTSQLEFYADHTAPAVTENEIIAGGSSIFKYQAACPFRAFAQCRLDARALPLPQAGLTAQERGSLLHRILEIIWHQLQDSAHLIALNDMELNNVIAQAIEVALLELIKQRPQIFKERFTQIEKIRLHKIISAWLALEKQRPPFRVYALETTQTVQMGNIPINLRIDRIDQLADGNYIIFDYKTSMHVSTQHWFSDRPEEPQLPLYIATNQLPFTAVAFACIRSNNVEFVGISAENADIKGIVPLEKLALDLLCHDWPTLIAQWQRVLNELAQQFSTGHAQRNPKHADKTCRYCDLKTLCRITEQNEYAS